MSNIYDKFRREIAAGGAVDAEGNPTDEEDRTSGIISGVIVVALLAWLGSRNPWILLFVLGLIVSVFLHEVGHFVTARRSGMKVTQFFMGFGPKVWSTTRGEVEYGVRALPLGAYVRIVGMNNLDEVEPGDETRAYRTKSYPKKMLVITAGSLMHLVIGVALFVGIYATAGRLQETGTVTVRDVYPGTAAASAGIRGGDVIFSLDGDSIRTREDLFEAVTSRAEGDVVAIEIGRAEDRLVLQAVLGEYEGSDGVGFLGVATESADYVKLGPLDAVGSGIGDIGRVVTDSVRGIVTVLNPWNTIEHLRNDEDVDLATRPTTVVGISQFSGSIGDEDGLKGVLVLLASLNIFVGVFNMLPLLPFDGGHAAIATYERLRSRRGRRYEADVAKMMPVATVVVGLLVFLMFSGLYLDIVRPIG